MSLNSFGSKPVRAQASSKELLAQLARRVILPKRALHVGMTGRDGDDPSLDSAKDTEQPF
jgi:hypothetical protein